MPPTVTVKSTVPGVRTQREAAAQRVLAHFGIQLPDVNLLSFFDDEDWHALKEEIGASNRGVYTDIRRGGTVWSRAPQYLTDLLVVDGQLAFDRFIYLHGSTCLKEVGLT